MFFRHRSLFYCGLGLATLLIALLFTVQPAIKHKYKEITSSRRPVLTDQCGSTWQTFYRSFHQSALKSPNTNKFLSYYCSHTCGGVGNRFQGMLSLFYLAMLTNRAFLIHWAGPGELKEYLEPNQVNWSLPLKSVGNFQKTYWGGVNMRPPSGYAKSRQESKLHFQNWTSYADFDAYLHRLDAIGTIWPFAEYLRKNPFLSARAHLLGIPTSPWKMHGCAFHFLFKQSRTMKAALEEARNSLSRQPPLLGIHIRTSDHHFGRRNELSYRSRNTSSFFVCALRHSTFIRDKVNPKVKQLQWFLAADDQAVKAMAKEKYSDDIVTLDFRPRHIEYTRWRDRKNVFRDVLIDVFLLAESCYLLLTSKSSLSRLAAAVGLHNEETTADGERCLVNETSLRKTMSGISTSG